MKVFLPKHIPGHRNIADLGTRGLAKPEDVDVGTEWQDAPSFCSLPVEMWPITKEEFEEVPEEELLPKHRSNAIHVNAFPVFENLRSIFDNGNYFENCLGALARVLQASRHAVRVPEGWNKEREEGKIKEDLGKDITPEDYKIAEKVAFQLFQPDVDEVLQNPPTARKKSTNQRKFS